MADTETLQLLIQARDDATGTLIKVQRSIDGLAGNSIPALNRSMGQASEMSMRGEHRFLMLASSISGLPPIVSQATSTFLMFGFQIAAAALAVTYITKAIVDEMNAHDAMIESISKNADGLDRLAKSSDAAAGAAQHLLDLQREDAKIKIVALEKTIALANKGKEVQESFVPGMDVIGMPHQIDTMNISMERRNKILAAAAIELARLQTLVGGLQGTIFGPPAPSDRDLESQFFRERDAAEAAARAIKDYQTVRLMGGVSQIGGTGPMSDAGEHERLLADQDRREKERQGASLRNLQEYNARLLAMQRSTADKLKATQENLARNLTSIMDNAVDNIVQKFEEGRLRLADVFRGIFNDFMRMLLHRLMASLGLKLAMALIPGAGIGGVAVGGIGAFEGIEDVGGSIGSTARLSPSIGNVTSASAGSRSGVTVVVQGNLIGDERYVNETVIPAIERAARFQTTRIVTR